MVPCSQDSPSSVKNHSTRKLHNCIIELQVKVRNLEAKVKDYRHGYQQMGNSLISLCTFTDGIMRKAFMGFVCEQSMMKKNVRKLSKQGNLDEEEKKEDIIPLEI